MSILGPDNAISAKLDSTQNPRNIIQDLVKASPEQRASLMGEVSQLRNIVSLIQRQWSDSEKFAEDITEQIAAFPNIEQILGRPQNLKQIVLNVSKNEPGLYDCAHPDITHEHYHENIFILQKVLAVYEFLDQYLEAKNEFADVYGHIKLELMDKHINLFQHYSRFGLESSFDAEYREAYLSLFERQKHIIATIAIYEENKNILEKALEQELGSTNPLLKKMQSYLWSIHFGAMQAYYANIILAHNLKDEARLNESLRKFEAMTQYLGQNIMVICQYSNKQVTDCIQELIKYKKHIAQLSDREIKPTTLELNIRNMYRLLEEKDLNDGLDSDVYEHKEGVIPILNDLVDQIKMLEHHIASQSTIEKVETIFSQHLEMGQIVYHQSDSQHIALAMTTLMRTWIKWLVSCMSQVNIKYLELTYESIYLINRSLRVRLPFDVSEAFIGTVTDSSKELESALKLKDFSPESLVSWIEGKGAGGSTSHRKKTQKKKSKKPTSQLQEKDKSALDAKLHSKPQSQVKGSKREGSSSGTTDASDTENSLSNTFQALAIKSDNNPPVDTIESEEGWTRVSRNKASNTAPKGKGKTNQQRQRKQRNRKNNSKHSAAKRESPQGAALHNMTEMPPETSVLAETSQPIDMIPVEETVVVVSEALTSAVDKAVDVVEAQYPTVGQLPLKLPHDAQGVMTRLNQAKIANYVYGGCVRDNVLQKPYNDIDLVADCDEEAFKALFPHAQKKCALAGKTVYNLSATISVTLEPGLDLMAFSSERYLAVNALLANSQGGILDPLGVMSIVFAPELKPIPGCNIISAYKADPSRILRTIRYSTHLQRIWDIEIHQALTVCGHMLNRLPFGKFLSHLGELFLRGSGETHFHVFLNLGLLPNISLPLGSDWEKFVHAQSISFHFMKHELAQIDMCSAKQRTLQNRLYLLTLFLLPALEKMRLTHDNSDKTYSSVNLKSSITNVLEQFFLLYEGDIGVADKKVRQCQMLSLMEQVIWPRFIDYRHFYLKQNYYLAVMTMPPRHFYEPMREGIVDGALSIPTSTSAMPQYEAYVEGGTTYYPSPQTGQGRSSKNIRMNKM